MTIPPTIRLIAINRKKSVDVLVCSSKRKLEKRLINTAYRKTNSGRLLNMAETKDTGPCCIDQ